MKIRGSKELGEALGEGAGNSETAGKLVGTREKPGSRSSVPKAGTALGCSWPDSPSPDSARCALRRWNAVWPRAFRRHGPACRNAGLLLAPRAR